MMIYRKPIIITAVCVALIGAVASVLPFIPGPVEGFYHFMLDDALWHYGDGKVHICYPEFKTAEFSTAYSKVDGQWEQVNTLSPLLKIRLKPRLFSITWHGELDRTLKYKRVMKKSFPEWSEYTIEKKDESEQRSEPYL